MIAARAVGLLQPLGQRLPKRKQMVAGGFIACYHPSRRRLFRAVGSQASMARAISSEALPGVVPNSTAASVRTLMSARAASTRSCWNCGSARASWRSPIAPRFPPPPRSGSVRLRAAALARSAWIAGLSQHA